MEHLGTQQIETERLILRCFVPGDAQALFDKVGMNRIEARHDPNNPHSGDVMKKCGMRYEGTMRQADRNNQGICDASCYALLKSER